MAAPQVRRLHLASLRPPGGGGDQEWPVHGFVILHEKAGPILVDTGVGGPERVLTDWRVVNVAAKDALAACDLSPADVRIVINTHLHFDHCGQNTVFKHAPFYVQRSELERARVESKFLTDWFDFAGARFELLDGDAEVAEGVRVVATPGHTVGHQSVMVATDGGEELMIGDAAYTSVVYERGAALSRLPDGQAADRDAWERSLRHIHELRPGAVHFCHDTAVIHH